MTPIREHCWRPRLLRLGHDFVSPLRPVLFLPFAAVGPNPSRRSLINPGAPGGALALQSRIVTAISQLTTQVEEPEQFESSADLRASQGGLAVVRSIITPVTANAAIPA